MPTKRGCAQYSRACSTNPGAQDGPDEAVHARNRLGDLAHSLVVRANRRRRVDAVLAHQHDEPGGIEQHPELVAQRPDVHVEVEGGRLLGRSSSTPPARSVAHRRITYRPPPCGRRSAPSSPPCSWPSLPRGSPPATAAAASPRARTARPSPSGRRCADGRSPRSTRETARRARAGVRFDPRRRDGGHPDRRRADRRPRPPNTNIWVVPDLNPDGMALHRRQNGDGIDLNRNFPYRWKPIGDGGPFDYPGPRPLSEPERRAARLIRTLRPAITMVPPGAERRRPVRWGPGDGAALREARRAARAPAARYPGSALDLAEPPLPGTTSVVELAAGELSERAVDVRARR